MVADVIDDFWFSEFCVILAILPLLINQISEILEIFIYGNFNVWAENWGRFPIFQAYQVYILHLTNETKKNLDKKEKLY